MRSSSLMIMVSEKDIIEQHKNDSIIA